MISFSFSVSTADEARTAAEVCDFLAEQLTTPTKRTRRGKAAVEQPSVIVDPAVQTLPPEPASVDQIPNTVSDPAALYAALSGTPNGTAPPTPAAEPEVVAVIVESRDDRLEKTREAIKTRGGKWYSDYLAANKLDKKLSDFTEDELSAVLVAAS